MVIEVDRANDAGILNSLNLLFNVASLLQNAALGVLELLNLFVAFLDILGNGQTEPVMVLKTLIHLHIKLRDVLEQKLLFYGTKVA